MHATCESQPGSGQAAKCQRRSSSSISPSQAKLKLGREGGQVELPITFPTARLPTTACAWHAGRGTALHWVSGGREREGQAMYSHSLPSDFSLKAEYPVHVIKDIDINANT